MTRGRGILHTFNVNHSACWNCPLFYIQRRTTAGTGPVEERLGDNETISSAPDARRKQSTTQKYKTGVDKRTWSSVQLSDNASAAGRFQLFVLATGAW